MLLISNKKTQFFLIWTMLRPVAPRGQFHVWHGLRACSFCSSTRCTLAEYSGSRCQTCLNGTRPKYGMIFAILLLNTDLGNWYWLNTLAIPFVSSIYFSFAFVRPLIPSFHPKLGIRIVIIVARLLRYELTSFRSSVHFQHFWPFVSLLPLFCAWWIGLSAPDCQ